jgi:hypothetical protein
MTRQQNAEAFAAAIEQALNPAQNEPPTEDQDNGPRKPEPVPEAGSCGAPGAKEAARVADIEATLTRVLNLNPFN